MILRRQRSRVQDLAGTALLLALVGCGSLPSPTPSSVPTFDFAQAPMAVDDVDCRNLLPEGELARVLGGAWTFIGKQASSCLWQTSGGLIQLVVNTGSLVPRWRDALRETYAEDLHSPALGVEIWRESSSGSVAALGPDRGVIVHGVSSSDDAASLALIALSRL